MNGKEIYLYIYRAITLNSMVVKVLDWIILQKEQTTLNNSDLHFGF